MKTVLGVCSLAVLLMGCGGSDGLKVYSHKNAQSGQEEVRVDRGVHHAALGVDLKPHPTVRARFWELDSTHQQPPLAVTGELLKAGLQKAIHESGKLESYFFIAESHPEFWSRVAVASLQSADWKKALAKTPGNLNAAARQVLDQSAPWQEWGHAWQAYGYTLTLQSLEKVQTCPANSNEPSEKSLCGAMIAFKAARGNVTP